MIFDPERGPRCVLELGTAAEWFTVLVALVAVILSARALLASSKAIKRSDLQRLHERLMSFDVQVGRRLLFDVFNDKADWGKVRARHPDDWDRINYAVGTFQTLAELARREVVDLPEALEYWGGSVKRSWPAIESYISHRRTADGYPGAWNDLVWFATKAGARVTIAIKPEEI
jgi:hypothetical protein